MKKIMTNVILLSLVIYLVSIPIQGAATSTSPPILKDGIHSLIDEVYKFGISSRSLFNTYDKTLKVKIIVKENTLATFLPQTRIDYFVLHWTGRAFCSNEETLQYWENTQSAGKKSSHALINESGDIWLLMPVNQQAATNADQNNLGITDLGRQLFPGGINTVNLNTFNVETQTVSKEGDYSPETYTAIIVLTGETLLAMGKNTSVIHFHQEIAKRDPTLLQDPPYFYPGNDNTNNVLIEERVNRYKSEVNEYMQLRSKAGEEKLHFDDVFTSTTNDDLKKVKNVFKQIAGMNNNPTYYIQLQNE